MVYVFDEMASEIKRLPTEKEVQKVLKQKKLMNEIYEKYERLYIDKKVSGVDVGLRDKLWERYIKEKTKYENIFNKYMGYCY